MKDMNVFTIKDIENLSGVKAHTIRIWEQRYNFLKPQRTDTNIRFYNNEDLKKILNIALLNKFGYKISHIDKMNVDEINNKIVTLTHQEAQQERIVNQLLTHMVDVDMEQFEEVLNKQITSKGIDYVINATIFPFLEKTGILWVTNNICPAHEHLVSNIIRQKILVGIEQATTTSHSDKTAILFLPEGVFHEMGILYAYYLLKNRGVQVYYLGASVPLSDIEYLTNLKSPTFLFTHLTSLSQHFNIEKYFHNLQQRVGNTPVVFSGPVVVNYRKEVPQNFLIKKDLEELKLYFGS